MGAELVLGIDAGGSKTLALAADAAGGAVLARGEAGPANYQAVGQRAALVALDAAAQRAIREAVRLPQGEAARLPQGEAGRHSQGEAARHSQGEAARHPQGEAARQPQGEAGRVAALCLGAAGMDRPEDFALFQRWAAARFPGARVELVNDARIVLAAGTPAGWGLALISGTGSIAYGRAPDGRVARAGGWGYLLGDEGSGYDIGLQALRAATRAADGRGEPTTLLDAILAEWGLERAEALVRKVYGELARSEIARLAAVVERCAAEGDALAAAILDSAGAELARAAGAVLRKLEMPGATPAALTGGVLVGGERVRAALLRSAQAAGLPLDPVTIVREPAQGAVRLALEALGRRDEAPRPPTSSQSLSK